MLISIIIPTYNRKDSLSRSIKSVLDQTNEDWELIIIDDGSRDGTGEGLEPYLVDERVKYYYQPHQGVAVARNFGVEKSKGSYIVFLDSDDTFYPELIHFLQSCNISKYDLVCWEVLKIIDGKEELWKPRKLSRFYNNIQASFLAGSVGYKKSLFLKVGGYDPAMDFGENYELGFRISRENKLKIKIINKPLLKYNVDTGSRTSNSLDNRLKSGLHQYAKHKKEYEKHPKEKAQMAYIIGHVFEKKGEKDAALKYYKESWESGKSKLKALVKTIYLTIIK
ncbi:glycosyltransferase family 2 protein [Salinimicrobium marinum]|uniref:glycosyltransferase family 2 protein n=1 Tax=Salinimicrobium marinum TaxID=680283 RepID=UPI0016736C28|nr:glycosyltransferase family A protein [Salinimicrobium marinum]